MLSIPIRLFLSVIIDELTIKIAMIDPVYSTTDGEKRSKVGIVLRPWESGLNYFS